MTYNAFDGRLNLTHLIWQFFTSHVASPALDQYQIILLSVRGRLV